MNIQVTASHSDFNVFKSRSRPSTLRVTPPDVFILRTEALKLTLNGAPFYQRKILPNSYLSSSYKRCPPVCFFGGKGRSENSDEASTWKSIEKGMGKLKKEQSVEDALRQQIEKQEYYDDGGSGANRSGGGGRGGSGGGSGGSGDEGFRVWWDEQLQFILALSGLLFVYFYLIRGETWPYIVRDYIKAFIFRKKKSYRLKRNMQWCAERFRPIKNFFKSIYPPEDDDGRSCFPYPLAPLASEIANTRTWWDVPELYYALSPPRRKLKKDEDDSDKEPDDSDKEPDGSDKETDDSDKEADPEYDYESDEELFNELDKEDEDDYFEPYLLEDGDEDDKGKEVEDPADRLLAQLPKIDMAAVERIAGDVSAGEDSGGGLDIPLEILEDMIEDLKPSRGVKRLTRRIDVKIKRKRKRKNKMVFKEEEENVGDDGGGREGGR